MPMPSVQADLHVDHVDSVDQADLHVAQVQAHQQSQMRLAQQSTRVRMHNYHHGGGILVMHEITRVLVFALAW